MKSNNKKTLYNKGLVITYFGTGKGKTTAALGLALRAGGYGKKVKIIQFIKGNFRSGERLMIDKLKNVELKALGKGFVEILNDKKPLKDHKRAADAAMNEAESDLKDKRLFALILDEVLVAIDKDLVKKERLLSLIKRKPKKLHLILTGRAKIDEIIEKSDLVSEIREIKHPFARGATAVKGIDY